MAISNDVLAELDVYRGGRYPLDLRIRVGKYIRASRKAGVTWYGLCAELSLSNKTVKAWADLTTKTPRFVPVRTAQVPGVAKPVTLVSPAGWRLEDVDAELAAGLFRELAQ